MKKLNVQHNSELKTVVKSDSVLPYEKMKECLNLFNIIIHSLMISS